MLKECHDWEQIDYIRAVCPHCDHNDTYFGIGNGDVFRCQNETCKKLFKLGEQE